MGLSGSRKSTWAEQHFVRAQIVSSDHLRVVVGSGEDDLSAGAFALLERIVATRLAKRLTTVVDTLGFDASGRAGDGAAHGRGLIGSDSSDVRTAHPAVTFPGSPSATATHLRAIAAAAENAGFTALYVMDHCGRSRRSVAPGRTCWSASPPLRGLPR